MPVIDPNPLVEQVRADLRRRAGSTYAVGTRLPPMRRLSDDFGCSLGVVQMAINTLVAEGRLRSEPRKGIFVAEPPVTQKRDVALVLPTLKLEAMDAIIRGVRGGLRDESLRLDIQAADASYAGQIGLLDRLDLTRLAGVIICPPIADAYADAIQRFADRGVPVVQATHRLSEVRCDTVVIDGFDLGRGAAEHLLGCGHRRIGLLGMSQASRTMRDTLSGVRTALRNAGLDPDTLPSADFDLSQNDVEHPWASAEAAATRLLTENPGLTAVLAGSHYPALGAARAAATLGLSIPGDFSLMAMGADIQGLRLWQPGITLMEDPIEFICQRAAVRLEQVLAEPGQPPEVIQLPPRLIVRGSVAAPASGG
ncbi:substrate-binding domain-containing protein [Phycisphaera mikurensis]|uniref:Putative GntR family transcriptional regulator n=1 Tax=Phycisphaera mikurensis (strain NBRC 102666 / KCTC 22515 / FYK2301M01) TaxID=1142394 RepID=I0IBY1_PHYMF|nr:GntR family transcriptional regulator [Phycisphaera mikurensis]MBB6442007.1 LacI family transcriptional regulator [Phycisphaera mikurensis]BAM02769.1 putative GntR family transcriptional regulator [Phycisphaera mikurensis NBRC 102666]